MGGSLDRRREQMLRVSPHALREDHAQTDALGGRLSHGMRVHRNLVVSVMRRRNMGDEIKSPAEKAQIRREAEKKDYTAKTVSALTSPDTSSIRIAGLRHECERLGVWEEANRLALEAMTEEAIALGMAQRETPDPRMGFLRSKLTEAGRWTEVESRLERLASRPSIEVRTYTGFGDLRAALEHHRVDIAEAFTVLQAMGGVYAEFAKSLAAAKGWGVRIQSLGEICQKGKISLEALCQGLQHSTRCPFLLHTEGAAPAPQRAAESASEPSSKTLEIPAAKEAATIGDLWNAIEDSGEEISDFCNRMSKATTGNSSMVWSRLQFAGAHITLESFCRNYSVALDRFIAASPKLQLHFREAEESETTPQKKTILLASKLLGGREILSALKDSGVPFDRLDAALTDADDRVAGAWHLRCVLINDQDEGRSPDGDGGEAILVRFADTVKMLNRDPEFPFSFEFVLHDDEPEAAMRLTGEQVWFLRGQKEKEAGKTYSPPANVTPAFMMAYEAGYKGRMRDRYFAAAREATLPPFKLSPSASFRTLCQQFPGGLDALKAALANAGVPFDDVQELFDPTYRNYQVRQLRPFSEWSETELRTKLGLTFTDAE